MKAHILFVLVLLCWTPTPQPGRTARVAEYPSPTIRETQQVVVDGVTETWQLQWDKAPKPFCSARELSVAVTCPCSGFAYGEMGDLSLVRLRNGAEIDRLHLTPLFGEEPAAVVQRWPVDDKKDLDLWEEDIQKLVSRRAQVQAMHLEDYDHDGQRTEFYLQTEAVPCGKSVGVVIGLSRNNPRLHAFSSLSNPSRPLYLQRHEWRALRDDPSGAVTVVDWLCLDHGAGTQTEISLQWSTAGIAGQLREYTCPSQGEPRQLIKEEPL